MHLPDTPPNIVLYKMYTFFYNNIFSCCIVQNTIYTPYKEIFTKLICKCHNIVRSATYKFTKFLDSSRWNMTVPFHIVYRFSSNSMLNQIILWYSFFFHCLPKWRIIYHFYHLPLLTLSPNGTKNYRTYKYVAIIYIAYIIAIWYYKIYQKP